MGSGCKGIGTQSINTQHAKNIKTIGGCQRRVFCDADLELKFNFLPFYSEFGVKRLLHLQS